MVITGVGLINAAGEDPGQVWRAWAEGDCAAIASQPQFADEAFPSKLAAPVEFDPKERFGAREGRDMDRVSALAIFAGERALEAAGLAPGGFDPARLGVCLGTAFGGVRSSSHWYAVAATQPRGRISPLCIPMAMCNAPTYHLAHRIGAAGPSRTLSTACSSSSAALAAAVDLLRAGRADVVLAVGADAAVVPFIFRAWRGLRVMTQDNEAGSKAYRPFDEGRSGFVMGEAGVALVLETEAHARARGAPVRGEVLGYGNNLDVGGITASAQPLQAACLQGALEDGGLSAGDVGFVVAHGSGTVMNDGVEAQAITEVLGEVPVTDSKPVYGHVMGASGLVEVALALESLDRDLVPGIPNLTQLAKDCPIRVPGEGGIRPERSVCLIDSFGFGGTNVTVALRGRGERRPEAS